MNSLQGATLTRLHVRRDQVAAAIAEEDEGLPEALRAEKHRKMAQSPFSFFRGTSYLFWRDVYHDWRFALFGGTAALHTWVQGDAHVENFGAFSDHSGDIMYGLDDFDDAIVADYQFDLWRLAVSVVLDVRETGALDDAAAEAGVAALCKGYIRGVVDFERGHLDRPVRVENCDYGRLQRFLEKTRTKKTRRRMLDKWTRIDEDGERRFQTDAAKLEAVDASTRTAIEAAIPAYLETLSGPLAEEDRSHFRLKDCARRLWAGTGSLGIDRYYLLIEGDEDTQHDDVILDVKHQVPPPAYGQFSPAEREAYQAAFAHEAQRHAEAFRALSAHPDRYLGWMELQNRAFSVRERSPVKDDFPTDQLTKPKRLKRMAEQWGLILARHHVRAARCLNARTENERQFEAAFLERVRGAEQRFIGVVTAMAFNYADCTTLDHAQFVS